jgi:hypothetical protein
MSRSQYCVPGILLHQAVLRPSLNDAVTLEPHDLSAAAPVAPGAQRKVVLPAELQVGETSSHR